jgi:hypothetical protein
MVEHSSVARTVSPAKLLPRCEGCDVRERRQLFQGSLPTWRGGELRRRLDPRGGGGMLTTFPFVLEYVELRPRPISNELSLHT